MRPSTHNTTIALALLAALASGCSTASNDADPEGKQASPRTDSAAGSVSPSQGMSGMRHDSMGAMGAMSGMAGMTGDPDRDFLRMMSSHHKGMIAMAHHAKEKQGSAVRDIATKLDTKQDSEIDEMVTMLEREYKDQYVPTITTSDQQMVDDLKSRSGTAYDKAFLEHTVMHHEQAIRMIDEYLPKAKDARLKKLAQKMKAEQATETAEFRRKASAM